MIAHCPMVIATNPFVYLRGDILEVKTMNDYPHLQLSAAPLQLQRKEKIELKDEVKVLCTKLPHAAPLHSGSRDEYSVQESKHQTSRIRFGGGMDELGTKIMLFKTAVV